MMPASRSLYVARQEPDLSIRPMARLRLVSEDTGDRFEFVYLRSAVISPGFVPLVSFPNPRVRYQSGELFPLFQNRVIGRNRREFNALVTSLDLDVEAGPFEILERSGGHRTTDQIELFAEPERDPQGSAHCRFFVRGIRHVSGAEESIGSLAPGDALGVVPDPTNVFDSSAVRVLSESGTHLGWVPRYLTTYVHRALADCPANSFELTVAKVGDPSLGRHSLLTASLTCCWLDHIWPFGSEEFVPEVADSEVTVGAVA
jgi:hypothetical protein